mmetsp:Transcript_20497/g.64220  ORF Transcript_20497/g.64220 Transcript_20497/m.64220 type:complete len:606 (-) Transcript_20497:12-1829(-)
MGPMTLGSSTQGPPRRGQGPSTKRRRPGKRNGAHGQPLPLLGLRGRCSTCLSPHTRTHSWAPFTRELRAGLQLASEQRVLDLLLELVQRGGPSGSPCLGSAPLLGLLEGALDRLDRHRPKHRLLRQLAHAAESIAHDSVHDGAGSSDHRGADPEAALAVLLQPLEGPLGVLLGVVRLRDRTHDHESRARRLGLVGRRPRRARHAGGVPPQLLRHLEVKGGLDLVDARPLRARAVGPGVASGDRHRRRRRRRRGVALFPRPTARLGAAHVVRCLQQPPARLRRRHRLRLASEPVGVHVQAEADPPHRVELKLDHRLDKARQLGGGVERRFAGEHRRVGDRAWVDGGEGDAGLLVVILVQRVREHRETKLRVLVRLGAVKVVAVEHRDRVLGAELKPVEVLQVSDRVHAAAADGVVVAGDRADKDTARVGGLGEVVEEEGREEKVREVVDLHLLLVPVLGPLCVRQRWLVDGSVADESVDGLGRLPLLELVDKGAHGGERVELAVHRREQIRIEAVHLGHHIHLVQVAHGADDVVFSRAQQRRRRLAAEARRGARHHDQLLAAKPCVREARLPTEGGHVQVEASRGRDRRREREEDPHAGVRPKNEV